MKVMVIGGTGTIGRAVVEALNHEHDALAVGHTGGAYQVDLDSIDSIKQLFERVGSVDAVVVCAGLAAFGPLTELTDDDFALSLSSKLMGQVNVVRYGLPYVTDGGSFTLTTGVLNREPIPGGSAISLVNGGVEAFARAAALDLPRGIRINVVSPPWVRETLEAMGRDPSPGLPAATIARAYVDGVEGSSTGEMLDARAYA